MTGPTLQTARLRLRRFCPEDEADVARYISEPAFLRYLGPGFAGAKAFLEHNDGTDRDVMSSFAIDLDGSVVGSVHLGSEAPNMRGELACLISPEHWGRGLAEEACAAAIGYGFEVMGLDRIYARADARNGGSIRAMEELGLRREGLLREHRLDQEGKRADEVAYGLLRSEWVGQR